MKATSHFSVGLVVVSLLIAGQGCQPGAGSNPTPRATASAAQPTQGATATAQAAATATERPPSSTATTEPQAPPNNQETIRQWAVGAAASSQMGDENWGAIQAAGAPDTLTCDDAPSAWASQNGGQEEWLEVYYEVAVAPAEVNIYQTYGATQITKVELLDTGGVYHEIYADEPSETDCPFVMQIGIADGDYEAVAVKITLDEAFLHYWNEIDAVELVGLSTGKVVATPAALFATATPFPPPAGFQWRAGGESSPSGRFSVPQGVAVTADGTVYVTDMMKGIVLYDQAGHQKNIIQSSHMDAIGDVAVDPDGMLYVAAWGNNSVLAYDASGKLRWTTGGRGNVAGTFAQFSPTKLAVGPDGNVYVLDKNKTDSGDDLMRVQVFTPDGDYAREIVITDSWFTPDDLAFGPDGNLYILSGFVHFILVLTPDGSVVGRIGQDALADAYIYTGLDIDAAGNLYIAAVDHTAGVLKLDQYGELVATFGVEIADGQRPWPEGGFYAPMGVGVMPDGSMVFVTDHSGPYAYLTAFRFE